MTIELYKNSLITLEDAELYFEERYDSDKWFELDEANKQKLLITASKKMNAFDFVGNPLTENQPMVFPRDYDLPQDIKDAVCEEAIELINKSNDIHIKNQSNNLSSISLGVGSISYANQSLSHEERKLFSSTAKYHINKWLKKGFVLG